MKTAALVLTCLLGWPALATADPHAPKRLAGTYTLGTPSAVDPAPDEPRDALLRLQLTGDAARDVYRALRTPPRRDACFDDGTLTKAQGTILCSKHPTGSHECWIGVDLRTQRLASAFVC